MLSQLYRRGHVLLNSAFISDHEIHRRCTLFVARNISSEKSSDTTAAHQLESWRKIVGAATGDVACFRHVVDTLYHHCDEGSKHPPVEAFQDLVKLCIGNGDRDAMMKLVHISWRTDLHLDLREFQQEAPSVRASDASCTRP